jgi:hypothetical protein
MRVSTGQGIPVHADPGAPLACRGLGESDHGVLGRDIGRHAGRCHQARDRGGVDQRTALLADHLRHVAQAEEHTLHIDADHRIEHRLIIFRRVRELVFDAALLKKQSMRPNLSTAAFT